MNTIFDYSINEHKYLIEKLYSLIYPKLTSEGVFSLLKFIDSF
jgi:hypothetical protein